MTPSEAKATPTDPKPLAHEPGGKPSLDRLMEELG